MRDGVLVVRVYNDNVVPGRSPALIGQWFMTLKYLVMFPDYCKHSKITCHGGGAISGSFLLTDAKFRGSAIRGGIGPNSVGAGFSGELDMAIHYTHSAVLDPPPPPPNIGALDQLGAFPLEDDCKFGNMTEMKDFLQKLPVRFSIDFFVIRHAAIEMSDLFVGAHKHKMPFQATMMGTDPSKWAFAKQATEGRTYVDSITFAPLENATLLELVDYFKSQLLRSALFDAKALGTALGEIFTGLGANMGNQMGKINPFGQKRQSAHSQQL